MTIFFLALVVLLLAFVSRLLGAAIRTKLSLTYIMLDLANVMQTPIRYDDASTIYGAKVTSEEASKDIRLYLGCLI